MCRFFDLRIFSFLRSTVLTLLQFTQLSGSGTFACTIASVHGGKAVRAGVCAHNVTYCVAANKGSCYSKEIFKR